MRVSVAMKWIEILEIFILLRKDNNLCYITKAAK